MHDGRDCMVQTLSGESGLQPDFENVDSHLLCALVPAQAL